MNNDLLPNNLLFKCMHLMRNFIILELVSSRTRTPIRKCIRGTGAENIIGIPKKLI